MTKQIEQVLQKPRLALACMAAVLVLPLGAAHADSGFYIGGSVGNAGTDLEFEDGTDFDEDDFAWKAFGGYNFDLVV
ncbi:MAG TPA: hypothetical protein VFY03_04765, partial [Woeseiaceae bacterium]|nr:hypothetical protein [Woeseiaceae bacterium]